MSPNRELTMVGRIYMRMPQCLQCINKDQLTKRQGAVIALGFLFLVFLVIIFIQTKIEQSETAEKKQSSSPFIYGPDVHYGIVLDCGSSGTRVYVYVWPPHSGNPQDLLNIQQLNNEAGEPVVKKVSPGLATFEDHPEDASEYLKPLLQFAASHIPPQQHSETLLYILATAGMRLIPQEAQDAILLDLQRDIPKDFSFVISENNFEVISGKQEGVYAWIAVNYALQRFSHDGNDDASLVAVDIPGENGQVQQHVRRRTVGMIDMGGGSMQIAFEITANIDSIPKHLIAEFNLGCRTSDMEHTYRVYVTTFLGYGANEARSRYEEQLISQVKKKIAGSEQGTRRKRAAMRTQTQIPVQSVERDAKDDVYVKRLLNISTQGKQQLPKPIHSESLNEYGTEKTQRDPFKNIPDPCLQPGLIEEAREPEYKGKVTFSGTGDYLKCKESLVPLLNLSVPCEESPCSINGIHQPRISYHNNQFYGFSEFWYSMEDVFRKGGAYDHDVFEGSAKEFCAKRWSLLMEWKNKGLYPKADDERFRMQCFKSAWMTAAFHKGLRFPDTYKGLTSVQFINKRDVQWTLGALIHRTRYLPLREIEKMSMSQFKPSWFLPTHILYNEYLLVICFIIVVMAILLYIKRLKLCSTGNGRRDMSRVPSMSYFMTEDDQPQQGVRYGNVFTYP